MKHDPDYHGIELVRDDCHPDCGPVVVRGDNQHCHENIDGRCWHENEEGKQ